MPLHQEGPCLRQLGEKLFSSLQTLAALLLCQSLQVPCGLRCRDGYSFKYSTGLGELGLKFGRALDECIAPRLAARPWG